MGLYLMPVDTVGSRRAPKYLKSWINSTGMDVQWTMIDYGLEPWCIVNAHTDPTQDATLTANSDVDAIPTTFKKNLTSGQVTIITSKLEAINIPANWVSTAFTWQQLLRIVIGMFQFVQHYCALGGVVLFTAGIDLTTQFNTLPAAVRTRLIQCANDLNYDTSTLSGTSTLRQILNSMGLQWGGKLVIIGDIRI